LVRPRVAFRNMIDSIHMEPKNYWSKLSFGFNFGMTFIGMIHANRQDVNGMEDPHKPINFRLIAATRPHYQNMHVQGGTSQLFGYR
jgi:hypothetical protein